MKTILLIDASILMQRVRWSPTKTMSSIFQEISVIKNEAEADQVVFVQDDGASKFRFGIYPEYKAHRKEVVLSKKEKQEEKEMKEWGKNFHLLEDLILSVSLKNIEADDLIGMLYYTLKDSYKVLVASSDKDFATVIPRQHFFRINKMRFGEAEDTYGFGMKKWTMYQALVGDIADNIKGICGDKTAQILLNNFDSFPEMKAFEGDVLDLDGITGRNKRYTAKALADLQDEDVYDRLKLNVQLVSIWRNTNHLEPKEIEAYTEILDKIEKWEPIPEFDVTDDMEKFVGDDFELELLLEDYWENSNG